MQILVSNALRCVLPAQGSSSSRNGLRGIDGKATVHHGKLHQVVSEAEALLCPSDFSKVTPQEGVSRRSVHPEAKNLGDLTSCRFHNVNRVLPVIYNSQPSSQLIMLFM